MCHDDHRHALARQLSHHVQHLADHFRVERGRRFVKKHDLRLHRQRPHDCDTLLLPAGKHVRIFVLLIRQPDALQQLDRLRLRLLLRFKFERHRCHHNVFEHRLMWKKIEVLEYHPHLLPMPIDVDLLGRQLHALKINLPGGRLLEQIETP